MSKVVQQSIPPAAPAKQPDGTLIPVDQNEAGPSSPQRTNKRARLSEAAGIRNNASHELSAGAKWMLEQIDRMQKQYTQCVLAAVALLKHKTYARQMRLSGTRIPLHLTRRVETTWAAYETTRRQVGWYMARDANFASTPSHPLPEPPPLASLPPLPAHLTAPPLASPIPLASSSFLDPTPPHPVPPKSTIPPPYHRSSLVFPSNPINLPTDDIGTLDLSDLGMAELTAIINGGSFDFSGESKPLDGGLARGQGDLGGFLGDAADGWGLTPQAQAAEAQSFMASLSQAQPPARSDFTPSVIPGLTNNVLQSQMGGSKQPTPLDNADAFLASLGAAQQRPPLTQQQYIQSGIPTLPSHPTQPSAPSDFTFDFSGMDSEVDMAGLSELVGLFDNPDTSGLAGLDMATPVEQPGTDFQQIRPQQDQQQLPQQQLPAQQTNPQQGDNAAFLGSIGDGLDPGFPDLSQPMTLPPGDSRLEMQMHINEGYGPGIDLDDFNFGDGDMLNVDDAGFESLFAEFK